MSFNFCYDIFFNNMLELLLLEENKVISIKGKNLLKRIKYKKDENKDKMCPIALELFDENEYITKLPCNHIFKEESINKWLTEESNTCPVCRHVLPGIKKDKSKIILKEEEKIILHETFIGSINDY